MLREFGTRWPRIIVGLFTMVLLVGLSLTAGCSDDEEAKGKYYSSRAYKGHESDKDISNFIAEYPDAYGTRLDDCKTCHTGATVLDDEQDASYANPCDYCHFIIHPPEDWTQLPDGFEDTLNPYGLAYKRGGESRAAIAALADVDSDGDGFTNAVEIDDLRYPGDAGSSPGQPLAPTITFTREQLTALETHTQFGLANANKQQYDYYATYTGIRIVDILEAAGVDLVGATSIDLIAPDGYAKGFTIEQVTDEYPDHRFYAGFGAEDLGNDCAFVDYPANTHELADLDFIGATLDQAFWHILAYDRDGTTLATSYLDPVTGRIVGEGPYRNVVPPGYDEDGLNAPDRGKYEDTTGCTLPEWDYDSLKDHNAGAMVKGVVIIRINPMPEGYEEFDIGNGGWAMVEAGEILVYGHGVTGE